MHLDALQEVMVRWPNGERHFKKGQGIHTENSYKYTVDQFAQLLASAGFQGIQHWQDGAKQFAVFWAKA